MSPWYACAMFLKLTIQVDQIGNSVFFLIKMISLVSLREILKFPSDPHQQVEYVQERKV